MSTENKREIKFRAWDGEQMVSPDYIDRKGAAYWEEHSIPCTSNIIMQYTGLRDKYGKEIYEGDILISDELKIEIQYISNGFVGVYLNNYCTWLPVENKNYYQWELIGNIYENPDLIPTPEPQ